jgi:hypothetical protein
VRRLARYILNALTIASLLLCAASVVLWVRSHWLLEFVEWHAIDRTGGTVRVVSIGARAQSGLAGIGWQRDSWTGPSQKETDDVAAVPWQNGFTKRALPATGKWPEAHSIWNRAGFYYYSGHRPRLASGADRNVVAEGEGAYFLFPFWAPAIAAFVLPSVRTLRRISEARGDELLCAHCGYDLRATPDRCPECGAVPSPSLGGATLPRGRGA